MPNKPEPPMNSKLRLATLKGDTPMNPFNQKLDEILDKYYAPIKLPDSNREGLKQAIRKAVAEDMLELVGEDEKNPGIRKHIFAETFQGKRNKLRAELRQKIKEYGGLK